MLITRTPLRISIGGGGTDLPSYYSAHGGFVVAAAIDKYVYVAINRTFTDDYLIKYSALERVRKIEEIDHPIVRSALQLHPVGPSLEIVSVADIPAGTGLGSSGTFTVGLLRALHAYKDEPISTAELAEEACRIELEMLSRPGGKQDQYIASFGGLTCFSFGSSGSVEVSPLRLSPETIDDLGERLLMFFTGYSRDADVLLGEQRRRIEGGGDAMLEQLEYVESLGTRIRVALEAGDRTAFGELMHEHWVCKRQRSQQMSNEQINRWYELGLANGALGGKLVGAGGGGFLLFYATDPERLRNTFEREGLTEVRFGFDYEGSTVIVRDS